jgi:uncharacterized protein YkwD
MIASNAAICILAIASLAGDGQADEPPDPVVVELLAAHNQQRVERELPPLTLSNKLCESAAIHARDMATHLRLNHIGSDGSNPAQRARRVRYTGSVGENIAQGALTVEQAVLVWMESRGHRENILGKYEEMGAALVVSDWGAPYWCVVLGRSRSVRSRAVREPVEAEPAADAAAGDRINNEAAAAFVRALNGERKAIGQTPFQTDLLLSRSARAIAAAMAAKDDLEIGDRMKLVEKKAKQGRQIRMNAGANIPTPQEAVRQLVGEHEEDLADFREIGVGYALAKSGAPYWCAIIAKPAPTGRPGKRKTK